MSVFYFICFPAYSKIYSLVFFILYLFWIHLRNFFLGIENCSPANSNRRHGQGKSDEGKSESADKQLVYYIDITDIKGSIHILHRGQSQLETCRIA